VSVDIFTSLGCKDTPSPKSENYFTRTKQRKVANQLQQTSLSPHSPWFGEIRLSPSCAKGIEIAKKICKCAFLAVQELVLDL
jgi:hypothetical protein